MFDGKYHFSGITESSVCDEKLKLFQTHALASYREYVKKYFPEEVSNYPLSAPITLGVIVLDDEVFFIFIKSVQDQLSIQRSNSALKDILGDATDAPDPIKIKKILDVFNLQASQLIDIYKFSRLGFDFKFFSDNAPNEVAKKHFEFFGKTRAKEDHRSSEEKKQLIHSLVSSPVKFELFDVEKLIKRVNNEQFSSELKEAIKCYELNLYIASGSTASICLETILNIQCDLNGIAVDPRFIPNMANALKKNKVINEMLHTRLMSSNHLRRAYSHSKTGTRKQSDVENMLVTIEELVNTLYPETF